MRLFFAVSSAAAAGGGGGSVGSDLNDEWLGICGTIRQKKEEE